MLNRYKRNNFPTYRAVTRTLCVTHNRYTATNNTVILYRKFISYNMFGTFGKQSENIAEFMQSINYVQWFQNPQSTVKSYLQLLYKYTRASICFSEPCSLKTNKQRLLRKVRNIQRYGKLFQPLFFFNSVSWSDEF